MANNTALNGLENRLWTAADELRANSKLKSSEYSVLLSWASSKEVARELLETLRYEQLVLDRRKYQRSRAAVRLTIERTLEQLPPSYSSPAWQTTCDNVY